jgi:hypothetical protein
MPDEHQIDPAFLATRIDSEILIFLTDTNEQRPRSIEGIVRAYPARQDALAGLSRLHSTGLIHRIDGFVFATRSVLHRGDTQSRPTRTTGVTRGAAEPRRRVSYSRT